MCIRDSLLNSEQASGIFNGTSPNPVSNRAFSHALGRALNRPAKLTTPSWVLSALFGEMSELLLTGQAVLPKAAQASGFTFAHPELEPAFQDLLKR